ncbi:MAG TPA: MBL fold metallo-hydrolase [Dietzia timorensis]|uniref:MBL fold metallo-hydrolase n=1 Tax=Dietzia timorensis TaxID=499555 RepID=A0A921F6Q4_9ACTN|nr:MBL fold metallo-hydrolase [Dietzia timorensis]HJE91903.1 MBL fold metallo-hydrolase [Dietzia timorensis]
MSTDDITLLDEYTGHLPEPRTAAQFSTPNALVTKISLGDMDNNAYLVECKDSDKVLLIDAANDPTELVRFLRGYRSMRGLVVFTTHSHADHWLALRDIVDEFGAKTMAPAGDAEAIDVPTDEVVSHGDSIECGRISLEVITLHGHTTEGAALVLEDGGETHIFTGDSLFPGGPGKTSTPEAFTSLMDDLESRIFARYDDGVAFHPGHGDDSTLGDERPHLGEWRDRGW